MGKKIAELPTAVKDTRRGVGIGALERGVIIWVTNEGRDSTLTKEDPHGRQG
jgi:hypothetical protein